LRYDANCFGPERMQYLAVSWQRLRVGFDASRGLKASIFTLYYMLKNLMKLSPQKM